VRWARPEVGLVSPGEFIPIAEDTGLIIPIGEWVLGAACRQVQAWREAGHDLRVSVNLSARQFLQPDLVDMVQAALLNTGLPAERLELEITESALMLNVAKAVRIMTRLTDLGVKLALDDFGTGYSSLMYLKNFPISALKVDQQFVRGVPDDPDDSAIVATIVGMARSLKLAVVAEGVETPAQLGFLRGLGCQYMQGYHFSRPLPPEQFAEFLRRPKPAPGRRAGME
jgi:EAL domain-containing protein (putative c-di-GMP-specific phosphodiesterase class I)